MNQHQRTEWNERSREKHAQYGKPSDQVAERHELFRGKGFNMQHPEQNHHAKSMSARYEQESVVPYISLQLRMSMCA